MTKQISVPVGMVTHVGRGEPEELGGFPTSRIDYPEDQIRSGTIYLVPAAAETVRPGNSIQVDRYHVTVAGVGRPTRVWDCSDDGPPRKVVAVPVLIADAEWI